MKVLLIDDHFVVTEAIKLLLQQSLEFEVVSVCPNGLEAIKILETTGIDLVISDISMPEISGMALLEIVKSQYPKVKVLFFSMHNDEELIFNCYKKGAVGYLLKDYSSGQILEGALAVKRGEKAFTREMIQSFHHFNKSNNTPSTKLSPRELEILRLISKEVKNQQIANKLFISVSTVESHRKNLLKKTNTKSNIGLIRWALDQKII